MRKNVMHIAVIAMAVMLALSACGPAATPVAPTEAPTAAAPSFTIPDITAGKFNVVIVLIGFHADGGWSQAHLAGAQYMAEQDPTIAVQYVELVFPGPDAESVMRWPARVLT
jgi:ABC-type glycerol-3-phosphate transport system substrate-binding protein